MVRLNEQLTEALWPPSHAPPRFLVRELLLEENAYGVAPHPGLDGHDPDFDDPLAPVPDDLGDAVLPVTDAGGLSPDPYSGRTTPVPDPADDVDALEELEEEITTLAAHIHAATHRLLLLIADFDRRRGWELGGHRSCAHWLSFRTGIDLGTAREKVRTARVLVGLPLTSASMARGELSFSKGYAPYCTSLRWWSGRELSALLGPGWIGPRGIVKAVRPGPAAGMGLE